MEQVFISDKECLCRSLQIVVERGIEKRIEVEAANNVHELHTVSMTEATRRRHYTAGQQQ